jgi:hypothetical protein
VVRVDLDERSIDFVLAEPRSARKTAPRAGKKRRTRAGGRPGGDGKKSRHKSR